MHTQWKQNMKDKRLFPSLFALKKKHRKWRYARGKFTTEIMLYVISYPKNGLFIHFTMFFYLLCYCCCLLSATSHNMYLRWQFTDDRILFSGATFYFFLPFLCFFISFSLKLISFDIIYGHLWRDMRLDGCCFFLCCPCCCCMECAQFAVYGDDFIGRTDLWMKFSFHCVRCG